VDNKSIGIAILVGLGIFLFFMTKKVGVPVPTPAPPSPNGGYVGPGGIQPLRLMPAGSLANSTAGMLRYRNKETRNVEWSDDGLPTKIVIEREYYQLQGG